MGPRKEGRNAIIAREKVFFLKIYLREISFICWFTPSNGSIFCQAKPEVKNFIQVFYLGIGAQTLEPSSADSSRPLSGTWFGREAVETHNLVPICDAGISLSHNTVPMVILIF